MSNTWFNLNSLSALPSSLFLSITRCTKLTNPLFFSSPSVHQIRVESTPNQFLNNHSLNEEDNNDEIDNDHEGTTDVETKKHISNQKNVTLDLMKTNLNWTGRI